MKRAKSKRRFYYDYNNPILSYSGKATSGEAKGKYIYRDVHTDKYYYEKGKKLVKLSKIPKMTG